MHKLVVLDSFVLEPYSSIWSDSSTWSEGQTFIKSKKISSPCILFLIESEENICILSSKTVPEDWHTVDVVLFLGWVIDKSVILYVNYLKVF